MEIKDKNFWLLIYKLYCALCLPVFVLKDCFPSVFSDLGLYVWGAVPAPMANAFSLTGDYHVNEVIGPATHIRSSRKNICWKLPDGSSDLRCSSEWTSTSTSTKHMLEALRWIVWSSTAPHGKFSENLEGWRTTHSLINLHNLRTIHSDELGTFLTLHHCIKLCQYCGSNAPYQRKNLVCKYLW